MEVSETNVKVYGKLEFDCVVTNREVDSMNCVDRVSSLIGFKFVPME